jgi:endonuclease-3
VCQARRPLCEQCKVLRYCDSAPAELLMKLVDLPQ